MDKLYDKQHDIQLLVGVETSAETGRNNDWDWETVLFRPIVASSFKENLRNLKIELFTCCKIFVWKKDPRKEGKCALSVIDCVVFVMSFRFSPFRQVSSVMQGMR